MLVGGLAGGALYDFCLATLRQPVARGAEVTMARADRASRWCR